MIPSIILSMTVGDMLRYENYILFLRLMPDFNLIHQLNIINELFVINHIPQIPVHVRSLLNSKSVLNLGTFYIYVAIMFTLLMVSSGGDRRSIFCGLLEIFFHPIPVNSADSGRESGESRKVCGFFEVQAPDQ